LPTTTEIEYRKLLAEHRTSKGTLRAFANRLGIPSSRLRWWKSELARRDRQRANHSPRPSSDSGRPAPVALVPVRVVPDDERRSAGPAPRGPAYEVLLRGGRLVRVPDGFESGSLTALVAALEAVPC
jgi:hypothetical protein